MWENSSRGQHEESELLVVAAMVLNKATLPQYPSLVIQTEEEMTELKCMNVWIYHVI